MLSHFRHNYAPFIAEISLVLFLLGLFFPIKAAQSIGLTGIIIIACISLYQRPWPQINILWLAVCLLMLLTGLWGAYIAPNASVSWQYFWSYQMIGKGALCAIALCQITFYKEQLHRLVLILFCILLARNIEMLIYGSQHPVFWGVTSEHALLEYRSRGAHIVVLLPFVLTAALSLKKNLLIITFLLFLEMLLLASTGWRGAFLGLTIACFGIFICLHHWRFLFYFGIMLVATGCIGIFSKKGNLIASAISRGFSDGNRINLVWQPVLEMLAQSNWRGYGFGQARYLEISSAYTQTHPEIPVFGDAHNMILNFAMAAGWLGAFAFLSVLCVAIFANLKKFRSHQFERTAEQTTLLLGNAMAWLGTYGILGFTDQPNYNNFAALLVLTSISLACVSNYQQT